MTKNLKIRQTQNFPVSRYLFNVVQHPLTSCLLNSILISIRYRYTDVSMHMARPITENDAYYAAIGYLSRSRQMSLREIVTQIVTAINRLCEWCHENNIRCVCHVTR